MTGIAATRHRITRTGKTIENHKETGTVEEAERKMKPKDPKKEAEKAEKGTGIMTIIIAKKPYLEESESDYRATKDLKRNKGEKAKKEGETEDREKRKKRRPD